jgi:Bacterial lectin
MLAGLLLPPIQGYSARSFNFSDVSSATGLQLNRDAAVGNNALRLTPSLDWKIGTAWFAAKQPVANGFETALNFQITDLAGINDFCVRGNTGGDGIVFVIHNADSGTSTVAEEGGIGYHGIPNSMAVEFDTFCNQNDVGDPLFEAISLHSPTGPLLNQFF